MIAFPNAKINLGLHITAKRPDGFHDIETVFHPIKLSDIVEIVPYNSGTITPPKFKFHSTGIKITGKKSDNLCIKALTIMQKRFSVPSASVHLHKIIPLGSGLGGGSSDASYVILLANKLFGLGLSQDELIKTAAEIGSDCAFFIYNEPVLAFGRGDKFRKISLNLGGYFLRLVLPGIEVNTKFAYSILQPKTPEFDLEETIKLPVNLWKTRLVNDFEAPVFARYPELGRIKEQLYKSGAVYASMSGSGSTIFGIYDCLPVADRFPSHYKVWDEKF